MKTYINNILGIAVVIMVVFAACNKKQVASKNNEAKDQTMAEETKAPSVDIFAASFVGNLKAVEQHIGVGTDLNQKDQYGSTPLIIAITFGKTEVSKALIEAGADFHCRTADGSTPLHMASFFCRTEIVEKLLEAGADKSLVNKMGSTPLDAMLVPFDQIKPVYLQISKDLGPLGLKFDYDYIERTRPQIAQMLQDK